MAGTKGNTNAADGKAFARALRRALARKSDASVDEGLQAIAANLVDAAYKGEMWAIKEVADRIDGKPAQAVEHSGAVTVSYDVAVLSILKGEQPALEHDETRDDSGAESVTH